MVDGIIIEADFDKNKKLYFFDVEKALKAYNPEKRIKESKYSHIKDKKERDELKAKLVEQKREKFVSQLYRKEYKG